MTNIVNFGSRLVVPILACCVFVYFYPRYAHLIILLIALVLIIIGTGNLLQYRVARRWQRHEAVEKVAESQYSTTKYYYPLINYQYNFNGKDYDSSQVSFEIQNIWVSGYNSWGDKLDKKEKFWSGWTQGTKIPIYINTAMPNEAVVINALSKKRRSHHYALIIAGIIIFVLWGVLRYGGI